MPYAPVSGLSSLSTSVLQWRAQTRHMAPEVAPQMISKQNNIPRPADCDITNTAQDAVGLHLWTHCWPMLSLVSTRPTGPSLRSCFLASRPPACPGALVLCKPRCRTLHLPLLNFTRFLSAHFSSLSSQTCPPVYQPLTQPPQFVNHNDLHKCCI